MGLSTNGASVAGRRPSGAHRTTDQAHEAGPMPMGVAATLGEIGSKGREVRDHRICAPTCPAGADPRQRDGGGSSGRRSVLLCVPPTDCGHRWGGRPRGVRVVVRRRFDLMRRVRCAAPSRCSSPRRAGSRADTGDSPGVVTDASVAEAATRSRRALPRGAGWRRRCGGASVLSDRWRRGRWRRRWGWTFGPRRRVPMAPTAP